MADLLDSCGQGHARRLRIALVTPWRLEDPFAWSGMIPRILESLEEVAEVMPVSTAGVRTAVPDRVAAKLLGKLSSKKYLWDFGLATAFARGRALRACIRAAQPDVVLAVVASTDLAFVGDMGAPVVQFSDATFSAIRSFYPMFSDLHALSIVQANIVTERATRATDVFVVSSRWARDSLVSDYDVGTEQVHVAPTGPGIVPPPAFTRAQPSDNQLRTLLVATDWERKGGDRAVAAVAAARARGIDATLTIVGQAPDSFPDWATALGRLDASQLSKVYGRSDVLLELTEANAAGVTLTDAAAHGLPVIASAVGGVPSIVEHNRTGFLIETGPEYSDRAAAALVALADAELRAEISASAIRQYERELRWDVWAERTLHACRRAVESEAGKHRTRR